MNSHLITLVFAIDPATGQKRVVVVVNNTPVAGVENFTIGGDDRGQYMDIRVRDFDTVVSDPSAEMDQPKE